MSAWSSCSRDTASSKSTKARSRRAILLTLTLRSAHEGQQLSQLTEETIEVEPTLSLRRREARRLRQAARSARSRRRVETKLTISRRIGKRRTPRQRSRSVDGRSSTVEQRKLPELTRRSWTGSAASRTRPSCGPKSASELERQLKFYQQRQRVAQQITAQLTVTATWDLPQGHAPPPGPPRARAGGDGAAIAAASRTTRFAPT